MRFWQERKKLLFNSAWFKQIGRLTFLLSSACVAGLSAGALLLQQSHPDSNRVAAAVKISLVLLGVFWVRSLERRLADAGLPRWCFWPYFLAVSVACAGVHARGILGVPETLAFFVLVQIPTVLFPSKPGWLHQGAIQAGSRGESYPDYKRPVGRFQFLLRVLLIATLFAALSQLARGAGAGEAMWEMRIGIVLFAFVWIYSVEGRVLDAGLPGWLSIPYCLILPGVCVLPHALKIIDLRAVLALFVVLQIPTIFFRSRALDAVPAADGASEKENSRMSAVHEGQPVRPAMRLGGFEFAVYILLIAGLWYVLHLLRGDVEGGPMSWALVSGLDAGALFVCVLWVISVKGRLRDAGLRPWAIDFCLIVFAASLLPLAFGVARFPLALVVFAVLQIPAVVVRRGQIPSRFVPIDADF